MKDHFLFINIYKTILKIIFLIQIIEITVVNRLDKKST